MSITVITLIIVLYMLMGNEYYCNYSNYCPIYADGGMSITVITLIIVLYMLMGE